MSAQILSRIPWDDYKAMDGTSISQLKEMGRSPAHYLYRLDHPRVTKALSLGTAAHTAVLEPERFDSQFAIWNRRSDKTGNLCPRNGQYWNAFLADNEGKTVITDDEAEIAMRIQLAVHQFDDAAKYLKAGDPEITMQWEYARRDEFADGIAGRLCKGRVDWLTTVDDSRVLVGLKTSRDCRHFQFGSQAAKLGYHLQWAYYFDGYRTIHGDEPRMVEIVVENEPPHAVAVYSIPEEILLQGRDEYENLMRLLDECERTGEFPGPQLAEEDLTLPTWVYEQQDDLSDLGLE